MKPPRWFASLSVLFHMAIALFVRDLGYVPPNICIVRCYSSASALGQYERPAFQAGTPFFQ